MSFAEAMRAEIACTASTGSQLMRWEPPFRGSRSGWAFDGPAWRNHAKQSSNLCLRHSSPSAPCAGRVRSGAATCLRKRVVPPRGDVPCNRPWLLYLKAMHQCQAEGSRINYRVLFIRAREAVNLLKQPPPPHRSSTKSKARVLRPSPTANNELSSNPVPLQRSHYLW